MKRLVEQYKEEMVPALQKEFGIENKMAVPKVEKVSLNIGISQALKDEKLLEVMIETLQKITGQKPIKTISRKAISGFNVKAGMVVGLSVTLRNKRMYEFLEKLTRVVLPRVRDFRGIPEKSVDDQGNLAIGFNEHMVFPEVGEDEVDRFHGLEVSITTTTKSKKEGRKLLKLLGIPFRNLSTKKK